MLLQPDTAFRQLTPAASYITRRHVVTVEAADLVHWESHALPVISGGREQTTLMLSTTDESQGEVYSTELRPSLVCGGRYMDTEEGTGKEIGGRR